VRQDVAGVDAEGRRTSAAGETHRRVEGASVVGDLQRERRVACHGKRVIQAFTLIELTDTGTKGSFAVTSHIPGNTEPRRDGMVVIVLKGAVRSGDAAKEAGFLAIIRTRNDKQS